MATLQHCVLVPRAVMDVATGHRYAARLTPPREAAAGRLERREVYGYTLAAIVVIRGIELAVVARRDHALV
jgi:hypothetical protein